MFKYSIILLLLTVGFIWNSSAEPSAPKNRNFVIDSSLKFNVYKMTPYLCMDAIEQVSGSLQIPEGKDIVISLEKLNKTNLDDYISVINKNKLYELDAYICIPCTAIDLLSELAQKCPEIKNLMIVILIENKTMPNLSYFKKLSRLRILIARKQERKVIKKDELILLVVTKNEQDYLNALIFNAGRINTIDELCIAARYFDINLYSYSKQQHIENLSITAGRLTLPDDLGTISKLSLTCHVLSNFPEKINSFRNLSELEFHIDTPQYILVFPEMLKLEYLDMSWNFFSGVKFNNMPKLKTMKMENCSMLTQFSGLEGIKNLQDLSLNKVEILENATALSELHNLKSLDLSYCNKINSLEFLSKLSLIENLNLYGCTQIKDSSVISELSSLKTLNIVGCNIANYDFLSKLLNLQSLHISLNEIEENKIKEKVNSKCKIFPGCFIKLPF